MKPNGGRTKKESSRTGHGKRKVPASEPRVRKRARQSKESNGTHDADSAEDKNSRHGKKSHKKKIKYEEINIKVLRNVFI